MTKFLVKFTQFLSGEFYRSSIRQMDYKILSFRENKHFEQNIAQSTF